MNKKDKKPVAYFIANFDDNVVKIGYSGNVKNRLANLQTDSVKQLDLLFTFDGTRELESYYHEMFKEYRLKGEWFAMEGRLKNFINNQGIEFEDNHIKMLPSNMMQMLHSIEKSDMYNLIRLLDDVEYNNLNIVEVSDTKFTAKTYGIAVHTLWKGIRNLLKYNILLKSRYSTYVYHINPYIMYKGTEFKWKETIKVLNDIIPKKFFTHFNIEKMYK